MLPRSRVTVLILSLLAHIGKRDVFIPSIKFSRGCGRELVIKKAIYVSYKKKQCPVR